MKQKQVIARELCLGVDNVMMVSSSAKIGKEEVLAKIEHLLNTYK